MIMMNFSDKLNNLKNNNEQKNDMNYNAQNTPHYRQNSNYIDYSQGQSFNTPNQYNNEQYPYPDNAQYNNSFSNPDSQWMQQDYSNAYNEPEDYNPYNQQHGYPPSPHYQPQGQPYNQPYGQHYGQMPPQQPFHSPQGYDYGETNFESRNIVRQVNQYGVANDDSSTKQLGKRFLAAILDGVFISIPTTLLALLFVIPSIKQVVGAALYMENTGNIFAVMQVLAGKISALFVLNLVVFAAYCVILPAYVLQGRTLGKKLMKLCIVTIEGEEIPDVLTLVKREVLGKFLSSFLLIGYFMILFSKNHSGLHDRIAKTKVIDDDETY